MKKMIKAASSIMLAAAMAIGGTMSSVEVFASTAKTATVDYSKLPPYKLSIMAPEGNDSLDKSPYRQAFYTAIRKYTNTDVEFAFYDQTAYYDRIPLVLASGDLPTIMVMNKDSNFVNAVSNNVFWDVTDYYKNFNNLKFITDTAFNNAGVNGRMYSIPRSRAVGRNGVGYRRDWVKKLGMKDPTTLTDFYNMLVAFTKNDPDGNGKNDTYGMAVTSYAGPWDNIQVWYGAPNGWGLEDGKITPAHMTSEWKEALAFFRKINSEGLINPGWDTYDPGKWNDLIRGGSCGSAVDVVDRMAQWQENFDTNSIPGEIMIVGGFSGPKGLTLLPTSGYNGMLVFAKSKLKKADDLQRALYFIDKMSDPEMLNLAEWGALGIDYYFDKAVGYNVRYTKETAPAATKDALDASYRQGFNQITSYFINPATDKGRVQGAPMNKIRTLMNKVQTANEKYAVPNYGGSFVSNTYRDMGKDLDAIITNARLDYILGKIDDVGLQEALNRWLKSGGQRVIDEMNTLYANSVKK